jgi:hypothetical protein
LFDDGLLKALTSAQKRLSLAVKALAPKHKGGEMEEYFSAHNALLEAERALASKQGEPYAVPVEFPVQWDTGAPLPHVLMNDHKTLLLFLLNESDPAWDGSYVNIVSPNTSEPESLALVEFMACHSAKLGSPNDEVNQGHPLHGKGYQGYSALRVINSPWIKELQAINSVHRQYDPSRWGGLSHYILGFHDTTFECVARSFSVEKIRMSFPEALAFATRRLTA